MDMMAKLQFEVHKPIEIEVGGPFVGAEFHRGYMLPQRVSFYYPVANSLDRSQDYWTRDSSLIMHWKLEIDGKTQSTIGKQPARISLSPYSVSFHQKGSRYQLQSSYRFCATQPAMLTEIAIKNSSGESGEYVFTAEISNVLRTCHTYKPVAPANYLGHEKGAIFDYDDPDVGAATLFILNVAAMPIDIQPTREKCRLIYKQRLEPKQEFRIGLLIGSARRSEMPHLMTVLPSQYAADVKQFEELVETKSWKSSALHTGSAVTDLSAAWAKAILETNRHYIDGDVVPMPCPAEYNFFFTHDVLVTDLGAVNYDPARVKADLQFIASHAAHDATIPHAYYWKDGRYQTEWTGSDNWNNQWFIILTGSYLRHSADKELVRALYPLLTKGLENILKNKENDDLIWSRHPDWWDIGNNYGPRAYMTILTIKAIQEYSYISRVLDLNYDKLHQYQQLLQAMQTALNKRLWSDADGFLMNYNADGQMDKHYYAGSLLAAHYGLLADSRRQKLVETAKRQLLVKDMGIHIAYPPDFHRYGDYYKFVDNEVGAPYYYLNGGIWPNGNAWYALALLANGEYATAAQFIESTMAITGIMQGPNGQPAYYEVRSPDISDSRLYGKVDKPQFMWAAGWYLYCLYQQFGLNTQGWNIRLLPVMPKNFRDVYFTLYVNGRRLHVKVKGGTGVLHRIKYDGQDYPSVVFPVELPPLHEVEILSGNPIYPYLESTSAILQRCSYKDSNLVLTLASVAGFPNETNLICPALPRQMMLNAKPLPNCWTVQKFKHYYRVTLRFTHETNADQLRIHF